MPTSIAAPTAPTLKTIPSFLYQQYADDANLQAFIDAYNTIAQGYLDWANQTPLAVYTSPSIFGPLLDWVGEGIYGIPRPVFSTLSTKVIANDINASPINAMAINDSQKLQSGSAILATDDYYKRVLTWCLYVGDGRFVNFTKLRLRVARFLYGVNGSDVTLSQAQAVSLVANTGSGATAITITIPSAAGDASHYFSQALSAGTLPFPFQLVPTVVIA